MNNSAWAGFVDWFSGIFRGDLGTSLSSRQPVTELLEPKLINSEPQPFRPSAFDSD